MKVKNQVNATPKAAKQTKTPKKSQPVKVVEVAAEESEQEEVPKKLWKKSPNKKAAKGKKVVEEPPQVDYDDVEEADEQENEDNKEEVADDSDEEEVPKKIVSKKNPNKKNAKAKKVVEEPPEEDEDEVEEAEEQENDDEESESEENENNEAEDDEEEDEEDDDDDDDGPSEEAIGTEEPTIPSKVKSGEIPSTVPTSKIIHVGKLPKKCKQINLVEAFAKYGAIDQIHLMTTTTRTYANIAYKTEKAAQAAIADGKKVKVLDVLVPVSLKRINNVKNANAVAPKCTVNIKNIKNGTTEEQLKDHFKSCGEIGNIKLFTKFNTTYAYITFNEMSSLPAALKLHNSLLNDSNIRVAAVSNENRDSHTYDESLTVMIRNKQNLENIDVKKLETIFSKCGEIEYIDIICKKHVLAFVTFKTEEGAQNALKLNGKTQQEVELDLEPFSPLKKRSSIHVINLPKDCTVEDLVKHFSKAGEIANVVHNKNHAIIRFRDSDGYCKSFLYDESFIKGNIIFVEPHSTRKQALLKSKHFQKKGFKRPSENGHSVFKAKKFKADH